MNYPWYEEVGPGDPLDQGDLIEACPVSVFVDLPALPGVKAVDDLLGIIRKSVAVEQTRVVVMTQGCDLEHGKIRNVILCPIYHLHDYRADWEAAGILAIFRPWLLLGAGSRVEFEREVAGSPGRFVGFVVDAIDRAAILPVDEGPVDTLALVRGGGRRDDELGAKHGVEDRLTTGADLQ